MRHRAVFLLFFSALAAGPLCHAQERPAAAREDAIEASPYRRYLDSAEAVKQTDLKKSIDYITQAIASLGPQGQAPEMANALGSLGAVYLYHGQYDLAIDNLEQSLEIRKAAPTALLLGRAYVLNADYKKAEALLLSLPEQEGMSPGQQVERYETLGDACDGQGDTARAVTFYKAGLAIAEKNQLAGKTTALNSKIADSYARANRLQEARAWYDASLELANRQPPEQAVREKEKVADFYNRNNQYEAEIALRKKSLSTLKSLPAANAGQAPAAEVSPQRIAYKIANAYIAQDRYDEAISYLQQSIAGSDAGNDLDVQKDATRTLSEVYREKGDFNKALETYQAYVALVDTLYLRKEQELSRAARLNRELAEKQSRITGLEQERQLSQSRFDLALAEQQLIRERNKQQRWLIYSLIFGMLLLGLTAFFFYRSNRQQQLANNLLALKSLRSQMNPHFIFNALNSVNNFIARKDERSANRFLSEFSTLMRAVLENSEEDFIPLSKELDLIGRYLSLEHSRFPEAFDYRIEVDEHLDPEAFRIPPMLLQPYIENAIWHGLRYKEGKGFLLLKLEAIGKDSLKISITDTGIGRKKSAELKTAHQKKQTSRGMENIRRRIAILNDMYPEQIEVQISDLEADGSGTRVELTIKQAA